MSEASQGQGVDVIAETKKLDLPKGEYVVIGGGLLNALGIRPANDVDLLVSQAVFDKLVQEGWEPSEVTIAGRSRQKIAKGDVEAYSDFWGDDAKSIDIPALLSRAQYVDDVAFPSNEDFVLMKRLMGREKDIKDVELLEKYLASQ